LRGEAQKIESGMEMRNEPMGHVKIALMLLEVKLWQSHTKNHYSVLWCDVLRFCLLKMNL